MGRKKKLSPDREKQVQTTRAKYGEDFYSSIAKKGGQNNRKNLTSDHQRRAAQARWAKYRAEQAKVKKGESA